MIEVSLIQCFVVWAEKVALLEYIYSCGELHINFRAR